MALKRGYKRHWYECEWNGDIYLACDFPGGVLIVLENYTWLRRMETQFVRGFLIDHSHEPPELRPEQA